MGSLRRRIVGEPIGPGGGILNRGDGLGRAPSGIRLASAIASAAGFASLSRFGRGIPASIQRSISWNSSSIRMSDETFLSTRPWA